MNGMVKKKQRDYTKCIAYNTLRSEGYKCGLGFETAEDLEIVKGGFSWNAKGNEDNIFIEN